VQHSGKIWLVEDADIPAKTGSVDFDGEDVTLFVNQVELGTWSAVLFDEADDSRFVIHAGANDLVFEPDDYIAFGAEVEARAFRSKLVQEPNTEASPVTVAVEEVTPADTATEAVTDLTPAPIAVSIDQTSIVKNAGLAAVLSAIWPGLGQIYNGEIGKGVATMVLHVINFFLLFVLIGFLTGFAVWVWAIYDAYTVAERRLIASTS
jgi:TM2 domain-containing membrane protein YozV